jgi:hypothetical protein
MAFRARSFNHCIKFLPGRCRIFLGHRLSLAPITSANSPLPPYQSSTCRKRRSRKFDTIRNKSGVVSVNRSTAFIRKCISYRCRLIEMTSKIAATGLGQQSLSAGCSRATNRIQFW